MQQDGRATSGPILVMTAGGPNPWMVINALKTRFTSVDVLIEEPESKAEIFARRRRRLGTMAAIGQLATMAAAKLLRRFARDRQAEICRRFDADPTFNLSVPVTLVSTINSAETLQVIRRLRPAVILLVSTRVMKSVMIGSLPCPILNLHAGITPAFRGQMGGYWALAEGDPDSFGATVHLVDAGIDTGGILAQVRTAPEKGDFISTYPMLLTAAALPAICQAVEDVLQGRHQPQPARGRSHLYYPPTLWAWLWTGITRGIW